MYGAAHIPQVHGTPGNDHHSLVGQHLIEHDEQVLVPFDQDIVDDGLEGLFGDARHLTDALHIGDHGVLGVENSPDVAEQLEGRLVEGVHVDVRPLDAKAPFPFVLSLFARGPLGNQPETLRQLAVAKAVAEEPVLVRHPLGQQQRALGNPCHQLLVPLRLSDVHSANEVHSGVTPGAGAMGGAESRAVHLDIAVRDDGEARRHGDELQVRPQDQGDAEHEHPAHADGESDLRPVPHRFLRHRKAVRPEADESQSESDLGQRADPAHGTEVEHQCGEGHHPPCLPGEQDHGQDHAPGEAREDDPGPNQRQGRQHDNAPGHHRQRHQWCDDEPNGLQDSVDGEQAQVSVQDDASHAPHGTTCTTILPRVRPLSTSRFASTMSAKGITCSTTGLIVPAVTSSPRRTNCSPLADRRT